MKCQDSYPTWKGYLFRLQQEAPKPRPVLSCHKQGNDSNQPRFYGEEYHGLISREKAETLCSEEGNFLIRESQTERGRFTLVLRVLGLVKNFKLYWTEGKHYVGEKKFDSVFSLVEDGLITMYVESKAQDYIDKMSLEPVYNSLSRYSSIGSRHETRIEQIINHQHSTPNTPSPTENNHDEGLQKYPLQLYYDEKADLPSDRYYDREIFYNLPGNENFDSGNNSPRTPDVSDHQSEWESPLVTNQGHCRYHSDATSKFNLSLPEEVAQRIEIGIKKTLTPTSSDERKSHKKRIATEHSVFRQKDKTPIHDKNLKSFEQEQPAIPFPKNDGKSRRTSHEAYGALTNDEKRANEATTRRVSADSAPYSSKKQFTYHRPTVAQKKTSNVAHVRHLTAGIDNKTNGHGSQHCKTTSFADKGVKKSNHANSPHCHLLSSVDEVSRFGHLVDIQRQLDTETRHCDAMRDIINDLESHGRYSAKPWQDANCDRDFTSNGSNDHHFDINPLTNKHLFQAERTESVGSYESTFSNGSSRAESSSSNYSHDSGHVSSDADIVSSSPRFHRGFQRCVNNSPQLHRSLSHHQQARAGRLETRFDESPLRQNSDTDDRFSRSRSSSANRKRTPLSPLHHNFKHTIGVERTMVTKNHESPERFYEARHRSSPDDSRQQRSPKNKVKFEKLANEGSRSEKDQPEKELMVLHEASRDVMTQHRLKQNREIGQEQQSKHKQGKKLKLKVFSPIKSKKSPTLSSPAKLSSPSRHQCTMTSSPSRCERPLFNFASHYDKSHNFKSHTYRMPQWCEYCGNYLWGIIQQGMQCIDCGLNVHKQCAKLVPSDCQPALKHVKLVFGVDLTTLVKLHGTQHPIVVDMCIEEIEKRGMSWKGIYRSSEIQDDVLELKAAFDRNGLDMNLSSYADISAIAGVLKLYFREIPVPLLPYQLYSRFMNASKISQKDGKLDAIKMGLSAMPGAHLQTLKHLILHLGRVSEGSFENQMSAQELGIVFGPVLLRTPEKELNAQYINDTQHQQDVISTMIDFRHFLFGCG